MKRLISGLTICALFLFVFAFQSAVILNEQNDYVMRRQLGNHNFAPIVPTDPDSSYLSYTSFRQNIAHAAAAPQEILSGVAGKKIRFDCAEELYRFSIDVSYHSDLIYITPDPNENVKLSAAVITVLLSLDYVLGQDIDYAVMKSRQFIPIGYSFNSIDGTLRRNIFTGSFDGRGFEISNLYFADYDLLTTVEGEGEEQVDLALSPYYAMFPYNGGEICNLGLVNPTFELTFEHPDIHRAANLVGHNTSTGTVDKVYVVDNREDIFRAGIRMRAPVGASSIDYQAAGIVFENDGIFTDSYYVSKVVVNASYINSFTVQPVIFHNNTTASNLIYDKDAYQLTVNIGGNYFSITPPNEFALGESTDTLRSASSLGEDWYYYPVDRYPSLLGLNYSNGTYQISNAVDLIVFSKIINFNTVYNDIPFRAANYRLTADIDMNQVSPSAYKTIPIDFSGTLSGDNGSGSHYYISNMHLENGVVVDGNYYGGLFSLLSGTVSNLTFYNCSLTLSDAARYYSSKFKIGFIAGALIGGTVRDISCDVAMDLGNGSVGEMAVGSIVGVAGGRVEAVYTEGAIDSGANREYAVEHDIIVNYTVGGIVGKTDETIPLTIYNVLNTIDITGIGSGMTVTSSSAQAVIIIGGVIGEIINTGPAKHNIGWITNQGDITVNSFSVTSPLTQYIAGAVGMSRGAAYRLVSGFGEWSNQGLLDFTAAATNNIIAAGIVISNHSEATELVCLYNHNGFITTSYDNLRYTSLVYDIGTAGFTLSQSANYADYEINDAFDFSGIYSNDNIGAAVLLRFVENCGNITYSNITVNKEISIAGITLKENVNFLNVYYSGEIGVYSINNSYPIWITGITKTLSTDKYLKNCINEGAIILADYNSSANSYLSGLVNINYSGDLQSQDASTRPKATVGIINSVNYGNLLSVYNEEVYGIYGYGNVYAGGVVTLNCGSVQDTVNLGHIRFAHLSDYPSSVITFNTSEYVAGSVQSFAGGLTLGGVSALVGAGSSRIYDCTNSGEVLSITKNYSRAGGILAVCLYSEIKAGGVPTSLLVNDIEYSILSNCINYGNVSAVTASIYEYSTTNYSSSETAWYAGSSSGNYSVTTTVGTSERPGIYSSAGGVIGYGLSVMRRMVNHGEVSSTDVAGGIVGATYVLGTANGTVTTRVYIDTAINYGSVRAVNNSDYALINKINISYDNIFGYFYPTDSSFIFPDTVSDIRRFPEGKRGIGGIFGRLQRGRNGYMSAVGGNFDFIVNMDPDVDLIGRLDQVYNWSSTARFYIFPNCYYFSARKNDTTQAVFTGYEYFYSTSTRPVEYTYTIERTNNQRYRYENINGTWWRYTQNYVETFNEVSIEGPLLYAIGGTAYSQGTKESVVTSEPVSAEWREDSTSGAAIDGGPYDEFSNPFRLTAPIETYYNRSQKNLRTSIYYRGKNLPVPHVTENPYDLHGEFIYGEDFIMRDEATELSNGESITSYIYYVENGILSDRFRTDRSYGMYVLSTSSGSTYGSAIPANTDFTKVYRLDGILPYDADYEAIDLSDRTPLDQTIIDKYLTLLQTRYNDKSVLLSEQNLRLEEVGGAQSALINPTIDEQNRIITFELSLELIDYNQTNATFCVSYVVAPAMALIGARIEDFQGGIYLSDPEGFINLLKQDSGKIISEQIPPEMTIKVSDYRDITSSQTIVLGYFTSYSEAAYNNTVFLAAADYATAYQVRLVLKPRLAPGVESPKPSTVIVDGVSLTYADYISNPRPLSSVITVNFTDSERVLAVGTDIGEFITLYYGETEVDSAYYSLVTAPVSTSGNFSFTITFNERLRSGLYTIKYQYYYIDEPPRHLTVNRQSSAAGAICYLEHYSYCEMKEPPALTFTTYVNFGYDFAFENLSHQAVIDENLPAYLENRSFIVSFLDEFIIAPFATLSNILYDPITDIAYNNGYRTYRIRYQITAEDNTTVTTYTHYIAEREMGLADIYKNNNRVSIDNVFCMREAQMTIFSVDLGIDQSYATLLYNLYEDNPDLYFNIGVSGQSFGGTTYLPAEIVGISYRADRYLNIIIDQSTLPGEYTFTFTYHRDIQTITIGTALYITKNKGTSAYLVDIRFAESALETAYGQIYVSDNIGTIISSAYSPRIYYDGIDYDNADGAEVVNFRIDGQVANIPLIDYMPIFLPYLPPGSSISRLAYSTENPSGYWTPEVNDDSDSVLKATLATDFTLIPATGEEPGEDEDAIITYRITSEDGLNQVYYHITVIDIVYNVSIIFDLYYENGGFLTPAFESDELRDKIILINVKNFNTDVPLGLAPAPTVADFPEFTEITDYNNTVLMFYLPYTSFYKYRFGRNLSGYYGFIVDVPSAAAGQDYSYRIYFNGDELNDLSDYEAGVPGKYYYIQAGTKNRTRRFEIHISKAGPYQDDSWGLNDNKDSWK